MATNISKDDIKEINWNGVSWKEVTINGVTVWRAEEYIYQNGTLLSGASLSNLTNDGSTLNANVGADNNEENELTCYVGGIDVTNYDKLEVTMSFNKYVNFGSVALYYGIDSATILEPTANQSDTQTYPTVTLTLDTSTLTGTHSLAFKLYARNDSSNEMWAAHVYIKVAAIRLYN